LQTPRALFGRIEPAKKRRELIDSPETRDDAAYNAMATTQSIVPTLQILSGPLSGQLFTLDREVTTIGRNPECDVVLQPKSVSRKHAAILRKTSGFLIKDLGSTRGTFVNGQKLGQPVLLEDGNTVQIGEVLLSFSSRVVQIQDGGDEQSTVYAVIDVVGHSDRIFPVVKPEAKLKALRLISQELGGTLVLHELLDRIFNSLFEIFPRAERGFVLLREPGTDTLIPEAIRSRTGSAGELSISKTVLYRVLDEGHAILSKDLPGEYPESASVSDSQIRSLMCVPLLDQDRRPVGIMQIDTRDGRGRFDQDDLDLLVAVASQISIAVQNARLHKVLVRQREMDQELQFARQVMQSLLPELPASIPGYAFCAHYEPARHVGGDYCGFIPMGTAGAREPEAANRWAIAVGDVVGKGMPAALLTAKFSAEIRLFLQGDPDPDPAWVVGQLNRQFNGGGVLDLYITFLLVVLDVKQHRLRIVNAGHPCPLLRRRDGRLEEIGRSAAGLPLAIMSDYEYESVETTLEPGETIVLYTDGVTDAMNAANERFGDDRLRLTVTGAAGGAVETGDAIVRAVQRHVAERPQFDDITMICLSRN
jgi:serine phosphatase RsbU (regulator of sigma subunit)/pSer/pThr/pTyr-binding forkhead associated (FHA) protein